MVRLAVVRLLRTNNRKMSGINRIGLHDNSLRLNLGCNPDEFLLDSLRGRDDKLTLFKMQRDDLEGIVA